jgi:prepilin-type N-terminal cleavage/methylation domain-containing protein
MRSRLHKTVNIEASQRRGFSLVELVAAIGILVMVTTIVVVNFRSGERSRALHLGAEDIASNLRRTQSFALTGKEITGTTCTVKVGKAYDIRFRYATTYTVKGILKDECSSQVSQLEVTLESGSLPRFASVGELRLDSTVLPGTSELWIRFTPPFGDMSFSADQGTTFYPATSNDPTNPSAHIAVTPPGSSSERVEIRIDRMSGGITIQ